MIALIQKTSNAKVSVGGEKVSEIGVGLLIFLGISIDDSIQEAEKLVNKIVGLRIFSDEGDKMNLSIKDKGGEILAVSQFTLYADCKKGRRPSFIKAAPSETAKPLYDRFVILLKDNGLEVKEGVFGKHMEISLINDGPTTIILNSSDL